MLALVKYSKFPGVEEKALQESKEGSFIREKIGEETILLER